MIPRPARNSEFVGRVERSATRHSVGQAAAAGYATLHPPYSLGQAAMNPVKLVLKHFREDLK